MNLAAIRFRNTEDHIYPRGRNELVVSVSTAREDAETVTLVWWRRYDTEKAFRRRTAMTLRLRDAYLDHYQTTIQTDGISAYTRYALLFERGEERVWLGKNGFSETGEDENFFEFLWPNPTDTIRTPDWAEEQVYYQIFPERFRNGDPANDPPGAVRWGTPPTRENFMGGDLRGVIEKLDYIRGLGATCLYAMAETVDEAERRGIQREAAVSFLTGHIYNLTCNFLGYIPGKPPVSDACKVAIGLGDRLVLRDDWKKIWDDEVLGKVIATMLHPENPQI